MELEIQHPETPAERRRRTEDLPGQFYWCESKPVWGKIVQGSAAVICAHTHEELSGTSILRNLNHSQDTVHTVLRTGATPGNPEVSGHLTKGTVAAGSLGLVREPCRHDLLPLERLSP